MNKKIFFIFFLSAFFSRTDWVSAQQYGGSFSVGPGKPGTPVIFSVGNKLKVTSLPVSDLSYWSESMWYGEENHGHVVEGDASFYKGTTKLWSDKSGFVIDGPFFIWPDGKSLFGLGLREGEPQEIRLYSPIGKVLYDHEGWDFHISNNGRFISFFESPKKADYLEGRKEIVLLDSENLSEHKFIINTKNESFLTVSDDGYALLWRGDKYLLTNGAENKGVAIDPKILELGDYQKFAFIYRSDYLALWIDQDHKTLRYVDLSTGENLETVPLNVEGPHFFRIIPIHKGEMLICFSGAEASTETWEDDVSTSQGQISAFNLKGNMVWHRNYSISTLGNYYPSELISFSSADDEITFFPRYKSSWYRLKFDWGK